MYVYILAYHICNELATLPADGDLRGARMRYTSPQAMKSMNEVSWMAGNNPSLCRHEQDSSASPSQHMSRVAAARDAVAQDLVKRMHVPPAGGNPAAGASRPPLGRRAGAWGVGRLHLTAY